jgi:hypothetical protein
MKVAQELNFKDKAIHKLRIKKIPEKILNFSKVSNRISIH